MGSGGHLDDFPLWPDAERSSLLRAEKPAGIISFTSGRYFTAAGSPQKWSTCSWVT